MATSRYPNLFIIGAPKCGTTALTRYLSDHPDIYMSDQAGVKEPEYFCTDFKLHRRTIEKESEYLKLFREAPSDVRYLGDSSVSYIYSPEAIGSILRVSPNAKFIAMIRNPIDIARSLHNENFKSSICENVWDFEQAWLLQEDRLEGRHLPPGAFDARILQYGYLAKTGEHLKKVAGLIPDDQLLVIVYDDFFTARRKYYLQVLNFLSVKDDGRTVFPTVNPSVGYHFRTVQRLLNTISALREKLGIPGGWGIQRLIEKFNSYPDSQTLSDEFLDQLCGYFKEDVELLSKLLCRDFSNWLEPDAITQRKLS